MQYKRIWSSGNNVAVVTVVLCLFAIIKSTVNAQNIRSQKIEIGSSTRLMIVLEYASSVEITTTKSNKILWSTKSFGELQQYASLHTYAKSQDEIVITDAESLTKNMILDDKLGAHKVFATDVNIVIPEKISVSLVTKSAGKTNVSGHFNDLNLQSESGLINVNEIRGKIWIASKTGIIQVNKAVLLNYPQYRLERYGDRITTITAPKRRLKFITVLGEILIEDNFRSK